MPRIAFLAPANVKSPTAAPSLHRFVPRRALETTAFGYEVIARIDCVADCIAAVQWADCWCPDAAQFILIEAPTDLGAATCAGLVLAFNESHLRPKIRMVCEAGVLADRDLISILRRNAIGLLLASTDRCEMEALARQGILGVRLDAVSANGTAGKTGRDVDLLAIVETAHDLGLRLIASQVAVSKDVGELLACGFDYVSRRDGGFIPPEPSFAWQRKLV